MSSSKTVARGRPAAPRGHRPPLAANGERDGRQRGPAVDRRLQLLRAQRQRPRDRARRGRAARLAGEPRSGRIGRSPRRSAVGAPAVASARSAAAAARAVGVDPSGRVRRREGAGSNTSGCRRCLRRPVGAAGADPSGPGADTADDRPGAGAFYFILPQLAQVGDSFKAFQSIRLGMGSARSCSCRASPTWPAPSA